MGKTVAIKNVDEELYRMFKAAAALRGITLGEALNEAIRLWLEMSSLLNKYLKIEEEAARNREAYERLEKRLLRKYRGKYVAVADGNLIGVYNTREEAVEAVKKLSVNHAIVTKIEEKEAKPVEFGMSLFEGTL